MVLLVQLLVVDIEELFLVPEENELVRGPAKLGRMLTLSVVPVLLLLPSLSADPTPQSVTSRGSRSLSDDDILKALAIMLAGEGRQGRSEGQEEEVRQGLGRAPARQEDFEALDGECTTTGYEVRTREECEEINEIKCETINVTKHRNEIVPKCQTLVDQKCNVTHIEVPTQQCRQRHKNRCETLYKVVEDKEYREECKVDVQHVCEHHVPIEVPYPVEVPYHVEATADPPEPPYRQPEPQYGPPNPPMHKNRPTETPHSPLYVPYSSPSPPAPAPTASLRSELQDPQHYIADFTDSNPTESGLPGEEPRYHYDPTPGPRQAVSRLSREATLAHVVPLFSRTRRRRSVLFPAAENVNLYEKVVSGPRLGGTQDNQQQLRSLVREIMNNVITNNQHLGNLKATIKQPRSIDPVNYNLNIVHPPPHQHPLGGPVLAEPHHGGGLPQPVVTTHELPAPQGCRSIAVKECYQIPIIVPRKVPYEVKLSKNIVCSSHY